VHTALQVVNGLLHRGPIYPRLFADGNGDGLGDLPGIRDHRDHLGVDATWFSPFYPAPMADARTADEAESA
jgi:glycosidase